MIKPATRTGIKPLIALYSESGCGKTYSALLLARGLAGPNGRIVLVDSENGRGSLYADLPIFGGYDVRDIDEPFAPENYVAAINEVEESGAAVGILDSASHEWTGVGGVLDMAAENEKNSGKGLHNWKAPKFSHQKFVQRLMRSSIPWIVCLRAKFHVQQTKEGNKTVIVKDKFTSPIQADDFVFESTCCGELLPDHSLRLTKWSHPGLKACFPDKGLLEIKHGELIAKWCAAGGQVTPPLSPMEAELKAVKTKIWKKTQEIHGGDMAKLETWLYGQGYIGDTERLSDLDLDGLNELLTKL